MSGPDIHHRLENGIPGFRLLQRRVGEHAAIPADVPDPARGSILEPVARTISDIQLAVGVIGRAVLAGLVVIASAVNITVILGNMEINRPSAQLICHFRVSSPELLLRMLLAEQGILGGVVPQHKGIGVGQVGLETEGLGHADLLK